jgi:uncharacterized protein YhaN
MPFIVDDILIQFDDLRAGSTLKILSELSESTQVIFFTHHRHLVNLAQTVCDPSRLCIHELTDPLLLADADSVGSAAP